MINNYFFDLADDREDYFYADSAVRRTIQWPLAVSWPTLSGSTDPNVLLNDNPLEYLVYSGGINTTAISLARTERIGSISLNVVSGSEISVGIIAGESLNDPIPNFYGSPFTISGTAVADELYFTTAYADLPANYSELLVPLAGSGQHNVIFPVPIFNKSFLVVHSGAGMYALSQVLPRKATGAFDLEVNAIKAYHVSADLIDTIALQVSDSIVVSPDIPDKSITGDKILDGTVSGVLITPGTITSNEIAANTITAFNLNVDQLDAVAANMGNLVVNSGISIGDNGRLYVGSGEYTVINASGLSFKNPVQVTPPWTGPTAGEGLTIGQVQQYPPDVNSIKFAPYYYDASGILYDFDPPRYSTLIGQVQYREPGLSLDEVGNYSTFSIDAGWLPSESGQAYYVPTERSSAYFSTKSVADSSLILSASTPTTSSFISLRNNAITISGTGAGPSLNLSIPTVVDSASFAVVQKTPFLPGFPPITTELQTVTASEAVFNVPVIFNEGATQPSITLTCTATQAGTAINPAWNSAIQNTGFTWIGTRVYIPVTGYYTIDFNYSLSGGSSNRVDLYIDEVNVGRLANTNDQIGNRYRSTGTRYCTAGSSVQVVLLLATSRTLLVTAYGASYESPILHIVKVG